MADSCEYEGKSYSDGAVICISGREYRCDDGEWSDLATDCAQADGEEIRAEEAVGEHRGLQVSFSANDGVVVEESLLVAEVSEEAADEHEDDWQTSVAYLDSHKGSAFPRITISESTIYLTHTSSGTGRIRNTTLKGSGGEYVFKDGGRKSVQPGTYNHYINGSVRSGGGLRGRIASKIRYES